MHSTPRLGHCDPEATEAADRPAKDAFAVASAEGSSKLGLEAGLAPEQMPLHLSLTPSHLPSSDLPSPKTGIDSQPPVPAM